MEVFWSPLARHEQSETTRYVPHVLHLAKNGKLDALTHHLSALRTHEMGAPADAALDRRVAEALVQILGPD